MPVELFCACILVGVPARHHVRRLFGRPSRSSCCVCGVKLSLHQPQFPTLLMGNRGLQYLCCSECVLSSMRLEDWTLHNDARSRFRVPKMADSCQAVIVGPTLLSLTHYRVSHPRPGTHVLPYRFQASCLFSIGPTHMNYNDGSLQRKSNMAARRCFPSISAAATLSGEVPLPSSTVA